MTMPEIGQPLPDLTFTSGFRENDQHRGPKGQREPRYRLLRRPHLPVVESGS